TGCWVCSWALVSYWRWLPACCAWATSHEAMTCGGHRPHRKGHCPCRHEWSFRTAVRVPRWNFCTPACPSDPHSASTVAATFTPTSPTLRTECEETHDPRPVHFRTRAAARRGRGGRPGRPTRPGQGGLRSQVR